MEMIAPLAKVLAEANGIDWRHINGTGQSGLVVEEDILAYLARIMTGEEEPPATPVDAPPPDWNGEMPSMHTLAAAGVDSDIADFVASARVENADPTVADLGIADLASADFGADAMDFELELDEDDQFDSPVTRDPEDMANTPRDADYAGAETLETPGGTDLPITPGPLNPGMPARPLTEPATQPTPGYVDPAQDAPAHQPSDSDFGLPQDAPTPEETPQDEAQDEGRSGWHDQQPEEQRTEAAPQTTSSMTGGLLSSLYSKPAQAEPAQSEPAQASQPDFADTPEFEEPEQPPVAATHLEPTVVQEAVSTPDVQPEPMQPQVVEPTVVTPPVQPQATAPTSAVYAEELAAPTAQRYATLRLSFDASALSSARTHLAEHFERPAPLSVFVARAASRRIDLLKLQSVGVYGVGDEVLPVATPNLTADFRAAVDDLHGAEGGQLSDLMVVDAGELGLDELQLPAGDLTLSLGRIRDGSATLTLTGPVSVRSGASFLQGVAELLETPIRLML
ncbi:E3 binding domain-containing protein [Deinococcus peraridilitoris]|nr:E3 binding domain-containing protein [Deinococcus peraridilitoris]